jgi:hypothetical protein
VLGWPSAAAEKSDRAVSSKSVGCAWIAFSFGDNQRLGTKFGDEAYWYFPSCLSGVIFAFLFFLREKIYNPL